MTACETLREFTVNCKVNASIYVSYLDWPFFQFSLLIYSPLTIQWILRNLKLLSWKLLFFPIGDVTPSVTSTITCLPRSLKSVSTHLLNQHCQLFPPQSLLSFEVPAWSQGFFKKINAFSIFLSEWYHSNSATQSPNGWIIVINIYLLDYSPLSISYTFSINSRIDLYFIFPQLIPVKILSTFHVDTFLSFLASGFNFSFFQDVIQGHQY